MTPSEIFNRLLDETAAIIAHPGALALPSDELHTEILLPLLPSMLGDRTIRDAWREHAGRGFFAKLKANREGDAPAPRWEPGDFEIHVTASYLAGPDAKALADTLLSEDSLRDLTAALMNQILANVWPTLPPPVIAAPATTGPELVPVETAPEISVAAVVPSIPPEAPAKAEPWSIPLPSFHADGEGPRRPVPSNPFRNPIRGVPRWLKNGCFATQFWTAGNPLRPGGDPAMDRNPLA